MWRGKEAKKYVTWRRNFEQCENSIPLLIASSVLLRSKNIISDGWLSLDVQVMEIWRSKPGTKVDDEGVILMKILTSCKIHPGSIRNHYLGWKIVGKSEFEFKIVWGSDPELKIIETMTGHHEYIREAAWCIGKNFPGSLFWVCRNLRLGYSSLILE